MGLYERVPKRSWGVAGACALALLGSAPAFAQPAAGTGAPSAYTPTMADWLAVNAVMQRYRWGVEKHDAKILESAFWPDGANIAVPSPGQEIRMSLDGSPPPGMAPPGGAGPGGPGGPAGGPGAAPQGEVWHLPFSDNFNFESPTRATHYQYFLSIYPQPEKAGDNLRPMDKRLSIVGWPGHYADVLEKRNGEWRILERKSFVNAK